MEKVEKMTFEQVCEAVACQTNLTSAQVEKALKSHARIAQEELRRGNSFSIYHLGVIESVPNGRNEGMNRVRFSSSTYVKEAINAKPSDLPPLR